MPTFVEVIVEATGRRESVPSDWVGDPELGKGISLAPPVDTPTPPPAAPPTGAPDVQTVLGESDDLPIIPAAREAVLAAREALASGAAPTEDDTVKVIDKFAADHDIDLGTARTKAEKVAVITAHLDTAGTEPADETAATADEEN